MRVSEQGAETGKTKRGFSPMVWTLIVAFAGLAFGLVAALLLGRTPAYPGQAVYVDIDYVDIVVSGVEIALIVSLLHVYNRTYFDTRARFTLGIVIVLTAILLEAILSDSAFYVAMGSVLPSRYAHRLVSPFTLAADVAETVAFAVFLYLGLQ